MFTKIIVKIESEKGAVDRILVTLLFVIIGIAALVLIEQWASDNKDLMMNKASNGITNIVDN